MSTDRSKALSKIQKLLKMAKDGRGNANEAETALRQAQSLMNKFNIDDAEASLHDLRNDPDAIAQAWCKAGYGKQAFLRRMPRWSGVLALGVGRLYECRTKAIWSEGQGLGVMFGGFKPDMQVAVWTFEFLITCVRRACDSFEDALKTGDADVLNDLGLNPIQAMCLLAETPKQRKILFREGMCIELQQRMYKLAEERANEQAASTAGTALVVAKEAALNAHFGAQTSRKTKRTLNGTHAAATNAGIAAAQKTDLGVKPLQRNSANVAPLLN